MDSSGLKEDIFYSSSWMQEILEISNIFAILSSGKFVFFAYKRKYVVDCS